MRKRTEGASICFAVLVCCRWYSKQHSKTPGEKQALTFMRTIMNMAHCMRTALSFNVGPTPRKDPSIMIHLNLF